MRLENRNQSESNLEQDENRMTTPQEPQLAFLEELLFSAQSEMYNHSKVFCEIHRLIELQIEKDHGDNGIQLLYFIDRKKEVTEIKSVGQSNSANW